MSNQKRIGLEGTIKAYAGCSRMIATIQRASSTELPAESGEKRRRAVRAVSTHPKPTVPGITPGLLIGSSTAKMPS
jgi:hypothetical protein